MIGCNFEELDELDIPFNRKVGLTVYLDDVKYEFFVILKRGSDKLLILSPSAINKSSKFDRTGPYPTGAHGNFPTQQSTTNPTRYWCPEDIDTGWCIGTRDNWYLLNISKIIMTIASNAGIENSRILFYGSSSGSYNSIQLATLNRDTRFLVDIPQLNISHYWPRHWINIKKYCFGDMDEELILTEYGHRISIIDLFNHENYFPKGTLMMDCSAEKDFNRQYTPFLYNLNNPEI